MTKSATKTTPKKKEYTTPSKGGNRKKNLLPKVKDRVKALFQDEVWYHGAITNINVGSAREILSIDVKFDDGAIETNMEWPDEYTLFDEEEEEEEEDEEEEEKLGKLGPQAPKTGKKSKVDL